MRTINKIIVHRSESDRPHHDNIRTIELWHLAKGWRAVGYHYFIRSNGTLEIGRPISQVGAHCYGHNSTSIGICLHGKDNFTEAQYKTLRQLIRNLRKLKKPLAVYGHDEFGKPNCPNFDLQKEIINKL